MTRYDVQKIDMTPATRNAQLSVDGYCANEQQAVLTVVLYYKNKKENTLHWTSGEIEGFKEDFVETHLCKLLCVILPSRVLLSVCPH